MVSKPINRREKFLTDAASLVAVASPSLAASLNTTTQAAQSGGNTAEPGKKSRAPPYRTCSACGTVLVPGWTSHIRILRSKTSSRSSSKRSRRSTGKGLENSSSRSNKGGVARPDLHEVAAFSGKRISEECLACRKASVSTLEKPPSPLPPQQQQQLPAARSHGSITTTTQPSPLPGSGDPLEAGKKAKRQRKQRKTTLLSQIRAADEEKNKKKEIAKKPAMDLMDFMSLAP